MPPIPQLIPSGGSSSLDERIDVICDAFEARWLSGDRPDIADFLPEQADDFSSQLFAELLLVDAEYRAQRGENVSKADYLARFPRYAAEVETVSCRLSWTTSPAEKKRSTFDSGALFLDRFVMAERLGAGAAGEVWKARDTRLQRTVAIKIPNSRITAADEVHRFVREGRSAAQLRHGHIVAVHEASQEGETAYIVSDFIDGRNLRQHLAENRLHPRAAAKLCAAIGHALHYAHQQGVVHRDLKPANIILDGNGKPHITDFGLAKWSGDATDLTMSGQVLGTPAYMSP
jgi:serine/threonine-protein kinase